MERQQLAVSQWKALVALLALACAAMAGWGVAYWPRIADPAMAGTLGVTLDKPDKQYFQAVRSLDPWSPLAKSGVAPGERILFDHGGDAQRQLGTDETIGLTHAPRKGAAKHLDVRPLPDPTVSSHPGRNVLALLRQWLPVVMEIVFGCLIGLRCAGINAMRALSLTLLIGAAGACAGALPGGPLQDALFMASPATAALSQACLLYFAITLHDARRLDDISRLRDPVLAFVLLFLVAAAFRTAELTRVLPAEIRSEVPLAQLWAIMELLIMLFTLSALSAGWRNGRGMLRQRAAWATLGLIPLAIATAHDTVSLVILGAPDDLPWLGLDVIAIAALSYAALRRRPRDPLSALERTLVLAAMLTVVLIAFIAAEWATAILLPYDGRAKHVVVDAAVALLLALKLRSLQGWAQWRIEKLFAPRWSEAAQRLAHFAQASTHMNDRALLLRKYGSALESYTQAQGVAIYTRLAGGDFELKSSSLPEAPPGMDANHEVAIEVQRAQNAIVLSEAHEALAGDVAFPMTARGQLEGVLVLGPRASGMPYREDELQLIMRSAWHVGQQLDTLRMADLERANAGLKAKVDTLASRLETVGAQLELAELRLSLVDDLE